MPAERSAGGRGGARCGGESRRRWPALRPVHHRQDTGRRRDGNRLPGSPGAAPPPDRRAQSDQARHGFPPGDRPLRVRTPGAGAHGPLQHRAGLRCGRRRGWPAVFRHGIRGGDSPAGILRCEPVEQRAAAGVVSRDLSGHPPRAPKRDHPPRSQAVQRAGRGAGRQGGSEGDRFRNREGSPSAGSPSAPCSRRQAC